MEDKARIVIYDDLVIIDETETFFSNNEQLAGIASSCLRSTPSAEMAEVYVRDKLKFKFRITNRGKIKKENTHPGWGGARPNSGPKPKGAERLDHILMFKVTKTMFEYVSKMDSFTKTDWLRSAIQEKINREKEGQ